MSVPIEAFELAVPEADLEDLRQRLAGWMWKFGRANRELTGG